MYLKQHFRCGRSAFIWTTYRKKGRFCGRSAEICPTYRIQDSRSAAFGMIVVNICYI